MNKKTFIKLAMAATLLTPSASLAGSQDVAVDRNNSKVLSTSGDCVRTKWQANTDECGGRVETVRRNNVSRSYLAFFDFNSSTLSSAAKGVIERTVDDARNDSTFIVTGHADRVGSSSYNDALSNRRAAAVEAELKRLGVSSDRIESNAKGESTPLISTKDGVKEPQNRRVEVVFTR